MATTSAVIVLGQPPNFRALLRWWFPSRPDATADETERTTDANSATRGPGRAMR